MAIGNSALEVVVVVVVVVASAFCRPVATTIKDKPNLKIGNCVSVKRQKKT